MTKHFTDKEMSISRIIDARIEGHDVVVLHGEAMRSLVSGVQHIGGVFDDDEINRSYPNHLVLVGRQHPTPDERLRAEWFALGYVWEREPEALFRVTALHV